MYSKDEIQTAKKKVKKKKEFYEHLMAYVTVNIGMLLLNLLTSPGNLWFYFPMLGWGIGLMFHYVDVFGIPGFGMLDKEWEERETESELRKMRSFDLPQLPSEKESELELKEMRKNYDESDFV